MKKMKISIKMGREKPDNLNDPEDQRKVQLEAECQNELQRQTNLMLNQEHLDLQNDQEFQELQEDQKQPKLL